ncbi:MAG: nucleoside hydrolase [Merdibacter sp.]
MDIGLCRHHRKIEEEHAVSFIVRTLKQATAPIDICAIGPLTNIAMALIMAPEIAEEYDFHYGRSALLRKQDACRRGELRRRSRGGANRIIERANLMINPIEANKSGATYGLKDIEDIERLGNETAKFVGTLLRKFIWRCGMLWG